MIDSFRKTTVYVLTNFNIVQYTGAIFWCSLNLPSPHWFPSASYPALKLCTLLIIVIRIVKHSCSHKQEPPRDPLPEDVQGRTTPSLGQQDNRKPFLRGSPRKNKTHAFREYRNHQSNEACSSPANLPLHDRTRRADVLVRLTSGFGRPSNPVPSYLPTQGTKS